MSNRTPGAWSDLADAFRGVTVTTVTPFLPETLDLDLLGFDANLRFLRQSGVSVVVPAGNTGEFSSLTAEEITVLTDRSVAAIGAHAAVVIGVGGDVRTAVALAQHAAQAGAAGIMIHEPTHPFLSDEGLVAYYAAICRAVDVGVAIYKRSPRIKDRLLVQVARDNRNVVAIKYAHNDVAAFLDLAEALPSGVTYACGSAERWALLFAAAGRVGFTSGIANFAPALTLRFWRALEHDRDAAQVLWREIVPLEVIRAAHNAAWNVPVIKYAMGLRGLAAGPVRPPLSPLDRPTEIAVASIIHEWNGEIGDVVTAGAGAQARSEQSLSLWAETEVDMA